MAVRFETKRFMSTCAVVAVATCIASPTLAQDKAPENEQTASSDIVVTGRKFIDIDTTGATKLPLSVMEVPQSIGLVSEDLIQVAQIRNPSDLADYAAGLSNVGSIYGAYSYVRSRGFILNEQFGYRLDGNRTYQQYALDDDLFDRIEIVRGPSSVVYGIGAPGGVVNYVLKSPSESASGQVMASLGSFATIDTLLQYSTPVNSSGTIKAIGVISYERSDGYVNYQDRESLNAYLKVTAELGDFVDASVYGIYQNQTSVTFDGIPLYSDASVPQVSRKLFVGDPDRNRLKFDVGLFGGQLDFGKGNPLTATLAASYQTGTANLYLAYPFGLDDAGNTDVFAFDLRNPYSVLNLEARAQYAFRMFGQEDNQILASVSYDRYDGNGAFRIGEVNGAGAVTVNIFDPQSTIVDRIRQFTLAPGEFSDALRSEQVVGTVQTVLRPLPGLALIGGISVNKAKQSSPGSDFSFDAQTSLRLGATYSLVKDVNVYFSYSESFTPQTRLDANDRVLSPLEGTQYEAGIKARAFGGRVLFTAAAFEIKQSNEAQLIVGTAPERYVALGEVRHRGLEFELNGNITPAWVISANLDILDTEISKADDSQLVGTKRLYIPETSGSIFSTYRIDMGDDRALELGGGARYNGSQRTGVANRIRAYTLFDLVAAYTIGNLEFRLNGRNIFDKKYQLASYSDVVFGVLPGEPRTVTGTVAFKF